MNVGAALCIIAILSAVPVVRNREKKKNSKEFTKFSKAQIKQNIRLMSFALNLSHTPHA